MLSIMRGEFTVESEEHFLLSALPLSLVLLAINYTSFVYWRTAL